MDALKGQLATDLSAIDLYLLSGHLAVDRRIELSEGVILEATTNSIGQYIFVVIGRASGTDYSPLQAYIQTELARPTPQPRAEPFAEPAMTLEGKRESHLRTVLRQLPLSPGVYLMKGPDGRVLYVGKADLLRHRVRSYFGSRPGSTRGSCA